MSERFTQVGREPELSMIAVCYISRVESLWWKAVPPLLSVYLVEWHFILWCSRFFLQVYFVS